MTKSSLLFSLRRKIKVQNRIKHRCHCIPFKRHFRSSQFTDSLEQLWLAIDAIYRLLKLITILKRNSCVFTWLKICNRHVHYIFSISIKLLNENQKLKTFSISELRFLRFSNSAAYSNYDKWVLPWIWTSKSLKLGSTTMLTNKVGSIYVQTTIY